MSDIRVVLKNEVKGCVGYKEEVDARGYKSCYLENLRLWRDENQNSLYIEVKPTGAELPTIVAESDLTESVSLYCSFPSSPKRERGVYRHESAEAELELGYRGDGREYDLRVKAKNIDDLRTLVHMIKTGSVGPLSGDSYECPQEELLKEEDKFGEDFFTALNELRTFLFSLEEEGSWWPLCSRKKVISKIGNLVRATQPK